MQKVKLLAAYALVALQFMLSILATSMLRRNVPPSIKTFLQVATFAGVIYAMQIIGGGIIHPSTLTLIVFSLWCAALYTVIGVVATYLTSALYKAVLSRLSTATLATLSPGYKTAESWSGAEVYWYIRLVSGQNAPIDSRHDAVSAIQAAIQSNAKPAFRTPSLAL